MNAIPARAAAPLSHDEYFALEQREDWRYEYCAGQVYAMSGGTENHALVSMSAGAALLAALRGKPCRVYNSDMKLYIRQHDHFCYPDAQVLCERGTRHRLYVENPVLVVEVLSPSTESYDRGGKFEHYRSIEALEYYLLIDPERLHVELYERESPAAWRLTEYKEGRVALPKLDAALDLADLYAQVDFSAAPPTP